MRIGTLATAVWLIILCMGAPWFMWVFAGICVLLFLVFYIWTLFYEYFKYRWISRNEDRFISHEDARDAWEKKHWIAEKFYYV